MKRASPMPQPLRQAWALAHALRTRPTPALATAYFDAIRRLLGSQSNPRPPVS